MGSIKKLLSSCVVLIVGIVVSAILAICALYNFIALGKLGDDWKDILGAVGTILAGKPDKGRNIYAPLLAFSIAEVIFAIVYFISCCPCFKKNKIMKILKGIFAAIALAFFIWYLVMHYTLYDGLPPHDSAFTEESKAGFICGVPYWDGCKAILDRASEKPSTYYMYGATALAEAMFYVGIILAVAAGIFTLVYVCICK